jgi:hypothetical protein
MMFLRLLTKGHVVKNAGYGVAMVPAAMKIPKFFRFLRTLAGKVKHTGRLIHSHGTHQDKGPVGHETRKPARYSPGLGKNFQE